MRRASGRARSVCVYAYGGRTVDLWWRQVSRNVERCDYLAVWNLPLAATQSLSRLASRNMGLQCTIQEGQVWLGDGENVVQIEPVCLQASRER